VSLPKCPLCGAECLAHDGDGTNEAGTIVICPVDGCPYEAYRPGHQRLVEQAAKARAFDEIASRARKHPDSQVAMVTLRACRYWHTEARVALGLPPVEQVKG
jgi:hypothetical protein